MFIILVSFLVVMTKYLRRRNSSKKFKLQICVDKARHDRADLAAGE